jgi:hypothetical protein
MGPDGTGPPFNQEECAPKRVGKLVWCDEWSRRSGLNGRPAVYETETGGLLKSLMTWAIPLSFLAIRTSAVHFYSVLLVANPVSLSLFLTLY